MPPVFAKVTTVELSATTVLPAASCSVAVSVCVPPEALEPDSVSSICVPAAWTIV